MISTIKKLIYAFVPSLIALNLLGISLITSFALMEIISLGVEVPFHVWLTTIRHDLINLMPFYSLIFGTGLIISLIAASFVARYLSLSNYIIDATAGFVSAFTALTLMNNLFDVTPIGATRNVAGLIALSTASGLAALIFSSIFRLKSQNIKT